MLKDTSSYTLHSPYNYIVGQPVPWGTIQLMDYVVGSPVSGKVKIHGKSSGTTGKVGDAWRSFAVALLLISRVTILARSPPLRHADASLSHHALGAKVRSGNPLIRAKLEPLDISYMTTPNDHMSSPKLFRAPETGTGAQ